MAKKKLPLKEVSIEELYLDSDQIKYEIPIYQRNYAWERDEITTFIQDVFDAYKKDSEKYYYVGSIIARLSLKYPYCQGRKSNVQQDFSKCHNSDKGSDRQMHRCD